jgi:hypothetical protein
MDEKGVSRYFREILDQIPEGLMVVNTDGVILFANRGHGAPDRLRCGRIGWVTVYHPQL